MSSTWTILGALAAGLGLAAVAVATTRSRLDLPGDPAEPVAPPAPPAPRARRLTELSSAELLELAAAHAETHGPTHPRTLELRAAAARRLHEAVEQEASR